ncbi:hypothetical protein UFOVP75_219 [uncultured Caudovirales phage]|uniref:Uncharacterized protein n=1 Tax=uncultured Caudovirales phage TaxID=2100421 RepID=A0A6J5L2P9_9CAUD|nr:hypothetical protein UFOVP75_219 [uncultured Caudovirales phage]
MMTPEQITKAALVALYVLGDSPHPDTYTTEHMEREITETKLLLAVPTVSVTQWHSLIVAYRSGNGWSYGNDYSRKQHPVMTDWFNLSSWIQEALTKYHKLILALKDI